MEQIFLHYTPRQLCRGVFYLHYFPAQALVFEIGNIDIQIKLMERGKNKTEKIPFSTDLFVYLNSKNLCVLKRGLFSFNKLI